MIPSKVFLMHVSFGLIGFGNALYLVFLFFQEEPLGIVVGFLENGYVSWSIILVILGIILLVTIIFGIRRILKRNIFCKLMGFYGIVMMFITGILLLGSSTLSSQITRLSFVMFILGLVMIVNQMVTSLKSDI